jgi:hypothetical protein
MVTNISNVYSSENDYYNDSKASFDYFAKQIDTIIRCEVVEVKGDKVNVKGIFKEKSPLNEEIESPVYHDVPVLNYGSDGFGIGIKVNAGDKGLLFANKIGKGNKNFDFGNSFFLLLTEKQDVKIKIDDTGIHIVMNVDVKGNIAINGDIKATGAIEGATIKAGNGKSKQIIDPQSGAVLAVVTNGIITG